MKEKNVDINEFHEKLKNGCSIYEVDDLITRKIRGFDHVLDYYHEFSCDHILEDISKPSLFINNFEDPVCYKENIPFSDLYRNENIFTLISERGGHTEYLCGKEERWWAFEIGLKYYDFLLKNN